MGYMERKMQHFPRITNFYFSLVIATKKKIYFLNRYVFYLDFAVDLSLIFTQL